MVHVNQKHCHHVCILFRRFGEYTSRLELCNNYACVHIRLFVQHTHTHTHTQTQCIDGISMQPAHISRCMDHLINLPLHEYTMAVGKKTMQ